MTMVRSRAHALIDRFAGLSQDAVNDQPRQTLGRFAPFAHHGPGQVH